MKNKVKKLALLTVLVIAAMTLPADSEAAKFCDYEYYYDAAHTQFAGYCYHRCEPTTDSYCFGEVTGYYALVNCVPYCLA